ncbi:MAG: MmgE/PrpD family protein [Dehalococcoidia bacterium]|nr:MmgE/PrpD family protein [Dehalococcoidia bacterium]
MAKNVGTALAEFAVNTKYESIPRDVVDFAKGLTLKTVAGMVVGATKPSGRKVSDLIRTRNLPQHASVMGNDFKTGLWEAVFLNAFFAHASELEDDSIMPTGGSGWDITVIPLLFTLAEEAKLSGKDLMEAIIVGLEVHHRTCMFPGEHVGLAFVTPAVGPAVAAAKARGLGVRETANAIGLSTSGVNLWMSNLGTEAHFLESAMQAMHGMVAADLAREGLTGNSDTGLFLSRLLGKDRVVPEKMVEDLGRQWLFQEIWVKKYPSCLMTHRPIDLVIELRAKHGLSYEQMEAIEVYVRPEDEICSRPQPQTESDLQFSIQHTCGSAMLDGDVGLEHCTEKAINDPRLQEARSKVKVIIRPELAGKGFLVPVRVVIRTKDGQQFTGERTYAIGSPKEPLVMQEFMQLYRKFTRGVLPKSEISKTEELILNLDRLGVRDVTELVRRLASAYNI